MVPVRCCLVADIDRRLGPEKPFPHTQTLARVMGDAVNGGMAFGCSNRAKSRPALSGRAFLVRSLSLRSYSWREEPKATKSRENRSAGCATPREAAWGQLGFSGAKSAGEPRARERVRNRRSRGRKKSSASLVEGRRLGPGKASSRHGGGVEAVSAGLTESEVRAPRKCAAPVSSGVRDRGVRGSVMRARGPEIPGMGRTGLHGARAIR